MRYSIILLMVVMLTMFAGCSSEKSVEVKPTDVEKEEYKIAIFAGGCFWCMEPIYEDREGIIACWFIGNGDNYYERRIRTNRSL